MYQVFDIVKTFLVNDFQFKNFYVNDLEFYG
jgi:hypothetical protein